MAAGPRTVQLVFLIEEITIMNWPFHKPAGIIEYKEREKKEDVWTKRPYNAPIEKEEEYTWNEEEHQP